MTGRRFRLAVVAPHVVQYQVPLYRALAQNPEIDLTVLFCSRAGSKEYFDREFGRRLSWDGPLERGYGHRFFSNWSLTPSSGGFFSRLNPGLVAHILGRRYDAIVVPGYATASYWIAYLGAWLSGTPVLFRGEVVLRESGPYWFGRVKRLLVGLLFRGTSGFLALGRAGREFYSSYGVPEARVFDTPYTVDNDFFMKEADRLGPQRAALREELGLPPDGPVVAFVGKLVPRKRPLDLIEAVASLDAPPGLLFVGDGALRPELENRARAAGLRHVSFAGFRNQSEIPRCYAAADLLALPSSHEVAPLVLNEAMCSGLGLVVSAAVPSAVDLVEDGVNGYVHKCGDVASLAEALRAALSSPERLRRLGERSRAKITRWSHAEVVAGLVAALRSHGRGAPPVSV